MIGTAVEHLPCLEDLIAVLFECFLIISLGYLSCRWKLISEHAKDLNSYLTTFALPMIIFLNIVRMEFETINISFLLCMLIAKLLVFIFVTLLTLAISYPSNFGYSGALSILATQSNDFALGYPLIKSLYGDARPEMLNYLSLMAPIQLLILNPLGIIMLEYEKSRELKMKTELEVNSCKCNKSEDANNKTVRMRKNQLNCIGTNYSSSSTEQDGDKCEQLAVEALIENSKSKGQQLRARRQSLGTESVSSEEMSLHRSVRSKNVKSLRLIIPGMRNFRESEDENSIKSFNEVDNQSIAKSAATTTSNVQSNYCYICRSTGSKRSETLINDEESRLRGSALNLNFLKALLTNPLIIASVVALIVNLIHGPELPKLVSKFSKTIAASFAAPSLFVIGLSMYGKFELLIQNPNDLILSSALVLTKVILLPSFMRTLALIMLPAQTPAEEMPYLVDFSYLYGLLPTAPTACIIAKQYGVLTNVVSISMILSIFISAPLMLAASLIINPSSIIKLADIQYLLSQTLKISSLVTTVLAPIALYAFWRSRRKINYRKFINVHDVCLQELSRIKTNPTHIFLFLLAISQIISGIGGLTWYFVDVVKMDPALHLTPHQEVVNSSPLHSKLAHNLSISSIPDTIPMEIPPSPIPIEEPVQDSFEDEASSWIETHLGDQLGSVGFFNNIQYVLASSGILLARFVILCILLTTAATRFQGHTFATKVSSLMVKSYIGLGLIVIIWLIFDSQDAKHFPSESSVPSQKDSLYIRLTYDIIFLLMSVPLFAMIIRSDNKSKKLLIKSSNDGITIIGCDRVNTLVKSHRSASTSNASLTSDTSSALTTNTNLDLTSNGLVVQDANNNPQALSNCIDSVTVIMDATTSIKRTMNQAFETIKSNRDDHSSHDQLSDINSSNRQTIANLTHYEPYESSQINSNQANSSHNFNLSPRTRCAGFIQMSEFNKYSILILFMLITTILNLTSIVQKLVQPGTCGTFRQIEIMGVALEFGQGLLTFLIYGIKGLFN